MQLYPDPPITRRNDLLFSRMSLLGLDVDVMERRCIGILDQLKSRCVACEFRAACAIDLRRDPNNPVWEGYCPNSPQLNQLTAAWWLLQ